jgi:hypothetical protein
MSSNGAEAGPGPSSAHSPTSPRASADMPPFAGDELERVRAEKDHLSHQYRSLLGKLTAMRNTLGEKLKEDAVGLGAASGAGGRTGRPRRFVPRPRSGA